MAVSFVLNGKPVSLDVDPEMPLLWAIREFAGLTGTKFGCGAAQCGACTVMVDGVATRSCQTFASSTVGHAIVTLEGLGGESDPSTVTRFASNLFGQPFEFVDGDPERQDLVRATRVEAPAGPFWEAEPEHQDYLERIPNGYTCHFVRPDWKLPHRA